MACAITVNQARYADTCSITAGIVYDFRIPGAAVTRKKPLRHADERRTAADYLDDKTIVLSTLHYYYTSTMNFCTVLALLACTTYIRCP